jgi:uncharacterized membrane protein required for colicin V production
VRRSLTTWIVAAMVALAVGVQILEASGRWDKTLQEANDEAGLVAIVLCIGVAIATANAFRQVIASSTRRVQYLVVSASTAVRFLSNSFDLPPLALSPPILLRV